VVALAALGAAAALAPPLYAAATVAAIAGLVLVFIRPEAGLVFLAFTVPFQSLRGSDPTDVTVTITEVMMALTVTSFVARYLIVERGSWRSGPLLRPILLLLAAMLLSVFKATNQLQSLKEIVKWLEFLSVYWMAINLFRGQPRKLAWFLAALVSAAFIEAIIGATQVVLRLGPPQFLIGGLILRAYGTFGQPNPFAGYLNLTLPILVGVALFAPSRHLRGATWFATAAMAVVMITTLSRGAWLGFAVALLVIGLVASRRVAVWIWVMLLAVAIVILAAVFGIIPFGITERVLSAFGLAGISLDNVTGENFSAVQRLAFWQAGLNMFENNPVLGVGIGNYMEAYPQYAAQGWETVLGHAHDYYLNAAAETGVVGLAAYIALLIAAFRQVSAAVRSAPRGIWYGVALGLLGSLTAVSVHNFVDDMYVHGIPVLVGLLLGSAAVINSFQQPATDG
jgi:putative inorganic carbon (hco3(-)) transporter